MAQERDEKKWNGKSGGGGAAPLGGAFWFAGWLFTIGFVNLTWWKVILGIVVWPYYLGAWLK